MDDANYKMLIDIITEDFPNISQKEGFSNQLSQIITDTFEPTQSVMEWNKKILSHFAMPLKEILKEEVNQRNYELPTDASPPDNFLKGMKPQRRDPVFAEIQEIKKHVSQLEERLKYLEQTIQIKPNRARLEKSEKIS